jgi:hypothetical protein
MGEDGVIYHFCYTVKGNPPLAGRTWSPSETSIPGKLVVLSRTIRDYVRDQANREVFLGVMDDQIEWFLSHSARV